MEIRDQIVEYVQRLSTLTGITKREILREIGLSKSKYYEWKRRYGMPNSLNSNSPKDHWITETEEIRITEYARNNVGEGYRRLTYMMIDENIAFVSPSSVYRVLFSNGLLKKWENSNEVLKGTGFKQPVKVHEHWHIDIKYVNFRGTFLFLISIIDGYSRYIVNHDLRKNMQEYDVEMVLQKAVELYPNAKPRIISDNGTQFISKDFQRFLSHVQLDHVRTSVAYPQSNGKIERFHKTINQECLTKKSLIDFDDAVKQIKSYIEFYNTKRLHSALRYLTPEDYFLGRNEERLKVRYIKLQKAKELRKSLNHNSKFSFAYSN
jgi:putative transposase